MTLIDRTAKILVRMEARHNNYYRLRIWSLQRLAYLMRDIEEYKRTLSFYIRESKNATTNHDGDDRQSAITS